MLTPEEQEKLDEEIKSLEERLISISNIFGSSILRANQFTPLKKQIEGVPIEETREKFSWHYLGWGLFTLKTDADLAAFEMLKKTLTHEFFTRYTIELTSMVFDLRTARFILNFEFTKRRRKLKYDPVPKEMRRQMAEADKKEMES